MSQLHLSFLMREMKYLASKTVFNDSLLARIITRFMNMFPFGFFLFTEEIISYCSNMSCYLLTLSCK